jgi:hypothetical protein
MFHKEFYPTPIEVIQMMQLDVAGKNVLEPHGGKGDIIKYCIENGAKNVYFSEIIPELATISSQKGGVQIGEDFLKVTELPPVDLIVMNPPFSNADEHILHAWEIAKDGTQIVALCNYETISNDYTRNRRYLGRLIKNHGESMNLGDVFSNAERTTGIDVGLIRLYKPITNANNYNFDFYFVDEDEQIDSNGIMPYNVVRDIVQRHVNAIKQFQIIRAEVDKLNNLTSKVGLDSLQMTYSYSGDRKGNVTTVNEFIRVHQRKSWNALFREFNLERFLTSTSREKLHQYMESKEGVPFTMKQVYHVMDVVRQTAEQNILEGLCEVMEKMTSNAYRNDNLTWKTNYPNKIGKKFIMSGLFERQEYFFGIRESYYSSNRAFKMEDFLKVSAYCLGMNYNSMPTWRGYLDDLTKKAQDGEVTLFGTWHNFTNEDGSHGFIDVKFFKKGTTHVRFINESDCNLLNKTYAEAFDKVIAQNN